MILKKGTKGRKKIADPKMPIRVYIETSHIEAVGGEEAAKVIAAGAIKTVSIKLNKKK